MIGNINNVKKESSYENVITVIMGSPVNTIIWVRGYMVLWL